MTHGPRRDRGPADLEIAGAVRAAEARWHQKADTATTASGDLETDEVRDREPDDPGRGRTYRNVRLIWQLRARLTDTARRHGPA